MIKKKCIICKKEFSIWPYKKNVAKFCSRECYWKSLNGNKGYWFGKCRSKSIIKICSTCKKRFKVIHSRKNTAKYCSLKCYYKNITSWLKGTKGIMKVNSGSFKKGQTSGCKNVRWKGGKRIGNKYISILSPNHPFTTKLGYLLEHRLVAEKEFRRYLTKEEIIHHINEIKTDNRPKNLYLFASISKHLKYHNLKNKPKLISNLL